MSLVDIVLVDVEMLVSACTTRLVAVLFSYGPYRTTRDTSMAKYNKVWREYDYQGTRKYNVTENKLAKKTHPSTTHRGSTLRQAAGWYRLPFASLYDSIRILTVRCTFTHLSFLYQAATARERQQLHSDRCLCCRQSEKNAIGQTHHAKYIVNRSESQAVKMEMA